MISLRHAARCFPEPYRISRTLAIGLSSGTKASYTPRLCASGFSLALGRIDRIRWASTNIASPESSVEEQLREGKLTKDDVQNLKGHFSFTTTNSLKLVMPMPDKESVVAFLLHTQQPLSYLETLIRNELPPESGQSAKIYFLDIQRDARWSSSIQVSDFIREAAATKQFCIDIQGAQHATITVNVPSFEDRTHFMRTRLGRLTETLQEQYKIKSECDNLAKNTARRYALCGMGGLVAYWVVVFQLTFFTSLGWDTMEPATYLCGLSALISGYVSQATNSRNAGTDSRAVLVPLP